uniref:Uncharacterized protein n=1 Tax=Kwoniella dejecticola CBS 10117 TaxID=1296121 RepID=A0A1A5ZY32_9TREE|nr:uncharacterized protein I303_07489 [Kwoniella dejecticola CBS 10117]OBR82722.1 hypothetical protein I303_07489 [Kwoniella dejecticola CBS 10117]
MPSSPNDPILPLHSPSASSSFHPPPPSTQDDNYVASQSNVEGTPCDVHPLERSNSAQAASAAGPPLPARQASTSPSNGLNNPRRTRRRQVTILPPITTSALGDLSNTHGSSGVPNSNSSAGRRRAHTVGVSMKPRQRIPSFSDQQYPNAEPENINDERSDRLAPLSSVRRGTINRNDLESGLNGLGPGFGSEEGKRGRARSSSNASRHSLRSEERRSRRSSTPVEFDLAAPGPGGQTESHQLDDELVGLLDVIDPEVSTVNHLQNMTNSVLVPHLPQLWKRRPEVQLPQIPSEESISALNQPSAQTRQRSSTTRSRKGSISRFLPGRSPAPPESVSQQEPKDQWGGTAPIPIPEFEEGVSPVVPDADARTRLLNGIDDGAGDGQAKQASPKTLQREEFEDDIEDIKEDHQLDKHVKHILKSSKRQKIKRGLKGLWTFVKTPMGAITAIYGFLVAFWGAAIVLFLLGWIPTNSKNTQDIWVEISSQVENGLFTVTGVGLIPWRVIDTYRMSVIWTLKNRDSRLRKKQGLPPIEDENDLPDPDLIKDYVFVLSEKDQKNLRYQQEKFATSQTWYRAHANATHRAFPMKFALWNTILMDGNSFFQCGTMWGLNRHQRPAWTTGCLIPLSFLCGIGAAVLIWQGSARTKKSALVSNKLREALNVPIALAIPRTIDGTVLNSTNNQAQATDLPLHKTESPTKLSPERTAGKGRRVTITFGHVDQESEGGEGGQIPLSRATNRDRGTTIASPQMVHKELDLDLGRVISAKERGDDDVTGREKGGNEDIAMKEVKS